MRLARQATCIEVLAEWLTVEQALPAVESLEDLFEPTPVPVAELVRRLQADIEVPRGALYTRLSRNFALLEQHADYFRSTPPAADLDEHVAAGLAFTALTEQLSTMKARGAPAGGIIVAAVREGALASALPEFLAERIYAMTDELPLTLPMALSPHELAAMTARVYARLCQEAGPAATDRALADALEVAAEATAFDPRRLL